MFGLAAGFYNSYLAPTKLSILLIGCDGAGKTTLLERCKVTEFGSGATTTTTAAAAAEGGKCLKRVEQPRTITTHVSWSGGDGDHYSDSVDDVGRHGMTQGHDHETEQATRRGMGEIDQRGRRRRGAGGEGVCSEDGTINSSSPTAEHGTHPFPPTPTVRRAYSDQQDPPSTTTSAATKKNTPQQPKQQQQRRRKLFFCPAPRSYAIEQSFADDQDEEEFSYTTSQEAGTSGEHLVPITNNNNEDTNIHSHQMSNNDSAKMAANVDIRGHAFSSENNKPSPPKLEKQTKLVEYDVKKGSKMLPLHLIRPTIGMNLGKIDIFGCKCSFWDLGGAEKMRPLWERYYFDADAIVFVVDASLSLPRTKSEGRSKLMESRDAFLRLLREQCLEHVPILLFANKIDILNADGDDADIDDDTRGAGLNTVRSNSNSGFTGTRSADKKEDDPAAHIHAVEDLEKEFGIKSEKIRNSRDDGDDGNKSLNEMVVLCYGSAKTGEGVRAAFEWLIPLAKQKQLERGRNR